MELIEEKLFVYGPSTLEYLSRRVIVRTFDAIPEPWRTYAMMLDAASSAMEGQYLNVTPFGEKAVEIAEHQALGKRTTTTFYMFHIDFWVEHGGVL